MVAKSNKISSQGLMSQETRRVPFKSQLNIIHLHDQRDTKPKHIPEGLSPPQGVHKKSLGWFMEWKLYQDRKKSENLTVANINEMWDESTTVLNGKINTHLRLNKSCWLSEVNHNLDTPVAHLNLCKGFTGKTADELFSVTPKYGGSLSEESPNGHKPASARQSRQKWPV